MHAFLFIKLVGIYILLYCHVEDIKINNNDVNYVPDVYNLYAYFGNYL